MRVIAILIETVILAGILVCFLFGLWLTVFDLGISPRYRKMLTMALIAAGVIVIVFFVGHLTAFYPAV